MRKNSQLVPILFLFSLFLLNGCGLRDDGAMNLDGRTVGILYLTTHNDLRGFKKNTEKYFGIPNVKPNKPNQLEWKNIDFYEFNNITVHAHFNNRVKLITESKYSGEENSVLFAIIDEENNDLLIKGSKSQKRIKKLLNTEIENFKTW